MTADQMIALSKLRKPALTRAPGFMGRQPGTHLWFFQLLFMVALSEFFMHSGTFLYMSNSEKLYLPHRKYQKILKTLIGNTVKYSKDLAVPIVNFTNLEKLLNDS